MYATLEIIFQLPHSQASENWEIQPVLPFNMLHFGSSQQFIWQACAPNVPFSLVTDGVHYTQDCMPHVQYLILELGKDIQQIPLTTKLLDISLEGKKSINKLEVNIFSAW